MGKMPDVTDKMSSGEASRTVGLCQEFGDTELYSQRRIAVPRGGVSRRPLLSSDIRFLAELVALGKVPITALEPSKGKFSRVGASASKGSNELMQQKRYDSFNARTHRREINRMPVSISADPDESVKRNASTWLRGVLGTSKRGSAILT